jgi:hypothetical protein
MRYAHVLTASVAALTQALQQDTNPRPLQAPRILVC